MHHPIRHIILQLYFPPFLKAHHYFVFHDEEQFNQQAAGA
jgi:hypothetical protein